MSRERPFTAPCDRCGQPADWKQIEGAVDPYRYRVLCPACDMVAAA